MTNRLATPAVKSDVDQCVEDMQLDMESMAKNLRRMADNIERQIHKVPTDSSSVLREVISLTTRGLGSLNLDVLVQAEARIHQVRTRELDAAHTAALAEARAGAATLETAGV